MKKTLSILLACIIIFASMPFCVNAYEIIAYEGNAYYKGRVHVIATEFVNHSDYVGEGPFDFFGVSIVEFQVGATSEQLGTDWELYWVTVSPEYDTKDAYEIISNAEGIYMASLSPVVVDPYEIATTAKFSEMTAEERLSLYTFVPDEITICFDYELDLAEFDSEEKKYLFGVSVAEISRVENTDGNVYNIKFGQQAMENHLAVQVLETNENVLWTEFETLYGNGDIDQSGVIDSSDYLMVKRFAFNTLDMTYYTAGYADVNNDGNVDSADYVLLKRLAFN